MEKILLSLFCALCFIRCDGYDDNIVDEESQSPNSWNAVAEQATQSLIKWFWNANGGYFNYNAGVADGPDYNYWPQAHALDVIIDAYIRTGSSTYSAMFPLWFEGIKQKSGGTYWNNYYDDMCWIALTMVRLYEVTNEQRYLTQAREMWKEVQSGWNEQVHGGGIAWKHDDPLARNACTNGPAALLGARLYQITKDQTDLDWAVKIYQWERDVLFEPSSGLVHDGIDADGTKVSYGLTYGKGTFMGAGQELYHITGNETYLRDARKCASYTISNMIDSGSNVLRDEGTGDNGLFKGIFMRYFIKMILEPALEDNYRSFYARFLCHNALIIWTKGVDESSMLFSSDWTTPAESTTQLTSQTSACMTIEARAYYERMKNQN